MLINANFFQVSRDRDNVQVLPSTPSPGMMNVKQMNILELVYLNKMIQQTMNIYSK